MSSILDTFATLTQGELMDRMLEATDDSFDKRQGSVLYDAISSVAVAEYDLLHDWFPQMYNASRIVTVTGDDLDDWASAFGIERRKASYAYWNIRISNEYGAVGDLEVGERLVAHDDDSIWYYVGASVAVAAQTGEQYPFGIAEPDNEYENITRVEFTTVHTEGLEEEDDASLRRRLIRKIQGGAAGCMNDYVNLVLHEFADAHPEYPPFTGCFIFPVQRRAGYVRIFPYHSNLVGENQVAFRNQCKALKEFLDPVDSEGYGQGRVPIGHRVRVRYFFPNTFDYKVYINDGTGRPVLASAEETEEIRNIIQAYFQKETNDAAYTESGNVPKRGANKYHIKIRTSNIIASLESFKEKHPEVDSFQLSIYRNNRYVESSDDAQDLDLNSTHDIPLPVVGDLTVYRGDRDAT